MNWLERIRSQPEYIRKIILWSVVIAVGVILAFFWLKSILYNLESFNKEELLEQVNLPEVGTELENLPKIEIPESSEEELKALEEELEKLEDNAE